MAALPHLGIIRVEGDDAAKFLQGQLTQDFLQLGMEQARLAAFCSAKGRMQASFIGFKRGPNEILLVCSLDILPATLKRLSMFVLRAKARLSDASADFTLRGLLGDAIKNIAISDHPALAKVDIGSINLIYLAPADGTRRALWVAPVTEPLPQAPELSTSLWLWSEVRSGIATLTAPVVDAFVPQMLNFESVGGVNFKKGCYPGQEVVARSQFRGTLKRRACIVHSNVDLAAGDEVFAPLDAEQPCATVVQAAASPLGGFDAIISGQLTALEGGALNLRSNTGPALTGLPLPYKLLNDV